MKKIYLFLSLFLILSCQDENKKKQSEVNTLEANNVKWEKKLFNKVTFELPSNFIKQSNASN